MYPIYCINLQNRIDRKQHTKEQFVKLNIPLDSVTYPHFTKDPSGGAFGCFRSHMFVWKDFLEKHPDKPYCLVLEDDFLVNTSDQECQRIIKDATEFLDSTDSVDILHLHNLCISTDSVVKPKTFHRGYGTMAHAYFVTRKFISGLREIPDAIGDQIDFTISFKHDSPIYSENQYYADKLYFSQYLNISDNYLNWFDQVIRTDHIFFSFFFYIVFGYLKDLGIISDSFIHWSMNTLNLLIARSITKEERRAIVREWVYILKKTGFNHTTLGYLVVTVHTVLGSLFGLTLVFSALDSWYIAFLLLMLVLILLTVYFNGCILVKIEQEFFGKEWKGEVHYLFSLFGLNLSSEHILSLFTTRMYMLAIWIGIRLWYGF